MPVPAQGFASERLVDPQPRLLGSTCAREGLIVRRLKAVIE